MRHRNIPFANEGLLRSGRGGDAPRTGDSINLIASEDPLDTARKLLMKKR